MKYSAWSDEEQWSVVQGVDYPKGDAPGMKLIYVFEADSWNDAMKQYHEFQGWEPYKPIPELS